MVLVFGTNCRGSASLCMACRPLPSVNIKLQCSVESISDGYTIKVTVTP